MKCGDVASVLDYMEAMDGHAREALCRVWGFGSMKSDGEDALLDMRASMGLTNYPDVWERNAMVSVVAALHTLGVFRAKDGYVEFADGWRRKYEIWRKANRRALE